MNISVVIPALNEEKYIERALIGLVKQDFPRKNFEIIVADNDSNDATAAIAKKYADKVVKEKRRGTNWARQAGYQATKFEIVAFLDADCIPPTSWLSTIAATFSKDKNANLGILAGGYLYYDLSTPTRSALLFTDQHLAPVFVSTMQYLTGKVAPIIRGGNMAMRRSALKTIGGFNTALTYWGDDTDTAIRIVKAGFKAGYNSRFLVKTSGRRLKREGQKLNFQYMKAYITTLINS